MACEIVKKYHEKDEINSQLALIRRVNEFGGITCLKVSTLAQNFDFISIQAFQDLLIRIWYNKIFPDTNKLILFVCLLCPFIGKFAIDYRVRPIASDGEKNSDLKSDRMLNENYDIESLKNKMDEAEIK